MPEHEHVVLTPQASSTSSEQSIVWCEHWVDGFYYVMKEAKRNNLDMKF